jgi:cell wall-associated NlpC family hydrolase
LRIAFLGSTIVALVAAAALPLAQSASGDSLTSAQAEATQLANQIQAEGDQVAALNERYDEDQIRTGQLDHQVAQTHTRIARTMARVRAARANLRGQALDDYMSGGSDNSLEQLFATGGTRASVAGEYQKVASGNVAEAIDRLNRAEVALNAQETQLQATETQAQATLNQAATAKQNAQTDLADQQATLSKVKGTIATLVAAKQQQEEQQQAAAFRAKVAAEAAAAAASAASQGDGSANPEPPPTAPPSAGGAAAVAVAAAMSQRGVPYVWAGDTPGVGFDCSGLTMWAWGQAGVSLPHSAAEQYADTEHVPLSDIEPGDLLFYDEGGTIGHVTMYIGGDQMVQAPETGEDVEVTGIWSRGLVGAGRP